jgi:hypothetical protein
MPTRFSNRYGARPRGQCVTAGCARATSRINGLCDRCTNNLRRHGEAQQTLPDTYALDDAVRRMEEARGRLKLLDLKALEARWTSLVDDCRGRAKPSFKVQKRLSYSKSDAEASALIRDVAEVMSFTRALDLLGAIRLLNIERPTTFRSEDAVACVAVELFRRAANVGRKFARILPGETRQHSYRKDVSKQTRLAAFRYINVGLGAAAEALAKREARRAEDAKAVRAEYWQAVQAIAEATPSVAAE